MRTPQVAESIQELVGSTPMRRLALTTGVLAGGSGGAAVVAAVEVASELAPSQRVVTLIPDSCERYLSKVGFPAAEEAALR